MQSRPVARAIVTVLGARMHVRIDGSAMAWSCAPGPAWRCPSQTEDILKTFSELGLIAPLCEALEKQGYTHPTPIQAQAIPLLLAEHDVFGCAQTGTGKTAAFALPILQHLVAQPQPTSGKRVIRTLVLTPTRELAAQIAASFATYGTFLDLTHTVLFGGVNERPQIQALQRGVDILVATPGRLMDLYRRKFINLSALRVFVLDEADRMLDMGFAPDVQRILAWLPKKRQNLLFSATMPPSILKLASSFLVNPKSVEVTPPATTVERIDQTVMFVEQSNKRFLLADLLKRESAKRSIVFTRTKHGANRVTQQLEQEGIRAAAIHGNKSQSARNKALAGFRAGELEVLVATDIAARGLDIDDVTHVFNFDLPDEPESYVHRIGRTARAGRDGRAISFCDASAERDQLRSIQRTIGRELPVTSDHPWHAPTSSGSPPPRRTPPPARGRRPSAGRTRR